VEHETPFSALINGHASPGMLVIHKAVQAAVEKAQADGFGIIGTNHTSTSTGALGWGPMRFSLARTLFIGIRIL
jgi:LDH2 family malate/lactate/ureidoglycolate dehydrogenase